MGMFRSDMNRLNATTWKHRLGDVLYRNMGVFTRGDYWFVDAAYGSDQSSGEDIDHPVKTIQHVVDLIAAKRVRTGRTYDDYIILLPTNAVDYDDDTVGASLANAYVYVNIPNVHIIGAGPLGSVVIKPDEAASVGVIVVGASGDRFSLHNVVIDTETALASAVYVVAAAQYPLIEDCVFQLTGASGPTGNGVNIAGKCSYPIIRNCVFYAGTLIAAAIKVQCHDAVPFGALVDKCTIVSSLNGAGTGCADGINVGDGTGIIIRNCNIHGGDTGTAYNIGDGIEVESGVKNTLIVGCNISGCDAQITDGGTDTDIVNCLTADGEGSEYANAEQVLPAGLS